ncbi:MAG: hypothetical protein PHV06_11205 [bacterium]|nr:hypothetical protein [bacterium]
MKRKLLLILALCMIGVFFLPGCISEKKLEEPKPVVKKPPTVTAETPTNINIEDEKFIYSPEGSNPFDPIITTVIKINIDKIKLVGIIWEEGNPTALVEDENKVGFMLREGDFVDPDKNIKVVSIDKKCIVFDIRKDLFHVTKKYCLNSE